MEYRAVLPGEYLRVAGGRRGARSIRGMRSADEDIEDAIEVDIARTGQVRSESRRGNGISKGPTKI